MKILHFVSVLGLGGAENMLRRLVESSPDSISESVVISLTSLGVVGATLRQRGVAVHTLGMSSWIYLPVTLWRLLRLIQRHKPTIVQTWMYHADLIGGAVARVAGYHSIVWGVRSTAIPQGRFSTTYWLIRLCAIGSYFIPNRIICCANSARLAHLKLRYAKNKMIVIPNGYDFSVFQSSAESRIKIRHQLGVEEQDIVITAIGRFDPLKDFHNFVSAAALVAQKIKNVKFLMIGRGNEWSNPILCSWIKSTNFTDDFILLGEQSDVISFLSATDIFCLSSVAEAFPNVVVEAMAMGLPCTVTCAGDAAIIVDDANLVVPVNDSVALADALLKICYLDPVDRKALGERNAQRVRSEYGIDVISQRYKEVYDWVAFKNCAKS